MILSQCNVRRLLSHALADPENFLMEGGSSFRSGVSSTKFYHFEATGKSRGDGEGGLVEFCFYVLICCFTSTVNS